MTYPQTAPPSEDHNPSPFGGGRASGRTVKKPGSLWALLVTSVASALSASAGALIVFSGGNGLADSNLQDAIKEHPDVVGLPTGTSVGSVKALAGSVWQQMVEDRAGTLSARAGFALFVAICMLVFVFFARKAAVWSRVMVTIWGLAGVIPSFLIIGDYEPTTVTALSWIALVCSAAAIALCWLPGVGRFAKERRAAG